MPHPDPHLNLLHTGHIYLIQTPTPTHLLSLGPRISVVGVYKGLNPCEVHTARAHQGRIHGRCAMNPKTERVLGFKGSGINAVRVAGQLETIEVCKVWPGGARTRIDRHELVRKHVVRSPREGRSDR